MIAGDSDGGHGDHGLPEPENSIYDHVDGLAARHTTNCRLSVCNPSQVFRATQALCDFLEKTEAELKNDKKKEKKRSIPVMTNQAKVEVYPGNDEPSQSRYRTERELNPAKFGISLDQPTIQKPKNDKIDVHADQDQDEFDCSDDDNTDGPGREEDTGGPLGINMSQSIKDQANLFGLLTIIYDLDTSDDPILYPMTIIVLMISIFLAAGHRNRKCYSADHTPAAA
ncbi:Hypothetical protein CINCED_3A021190 [Cinara cedri]|uniref:Uncharacterized protein n=1 Tax=Cinara cedri TaxID=506608 RepID=A0A5E4ML81_9HEMI|nr:Hypothetical protein CINCED_3A021190 [Cinara cedri]